MESPQDKLIESYSKEFQSQLRRINYYVNHKPSIGTVHEGILRRFLQRYIPKRYAVSEGFVLDTSQNASNQCDIIIWDQLEYSPTYIEGDFVIVQSESVRVVIEVKTKLTKKSLLDSYKNLQSVRSSGNHIYTALFSFEGMNISAILRHILQIEDKELAGSVNSIYAMNEWTLQQVLDIPFEESKKSIYEETRQDVLSQKNILYPLVLNLHETSKASVHGLTYFLAQIFINLNLAGYETPYNYNPGKLSSYIFPGIGISFEYPNLDQEDTTSSQKFLSGKLLEKYMASLRISKS